MSKSIVHVNVREDDVPLSYTQRRSWFLEKLVPECAAYNIPKVFHICGDLDICFLEKAWRLVLRNNRILRCGFKINGCKIFQKLANDMPANIDVIDFSSYEEHAAWEKSRELLEDISGRPFKLTEEPLFRILLIKINESNSLLSFCFHQIIADRNAIDLIFRELVSRYNAFKNGLELSSENHYDYLDFIYYQECISEQVGAAMKDSFWKEQFNTLPEVINLPYDYKRSSSFVRRFALYQMSFEDDIYQIIKQICQAGEYSPLAFCLSVLYVLLKRYTGQYDICISTPVSGHRINEFKNVAGPFEIHLPIRISIEDDLPFNEVLKIVDSILGQTRSTRNLPQQDIADNILHNSNSSLLSLFQVSIHIDTAIEDTLSFEGCICKEFGEYSISSEYDLSFAFKEHNGLLSGKIHYNASLFTSDTIARMGRHFTAILNSVLKNQEIKINAIGIMSNEELAKIERWNKTETDYPDHESIPSLFYKQVDLTPDSIAIIQKDLKITYLELSHKVEYLEMLLRKSRVGAGDKVIVCMERSVESIVCILAILKTGAIYVPLDPKYPQDRLLFIISDCKANIILTKNKFKKILFPSRKKMLLLEEGMPETRSSKKRALPRVNPDTQIYVMYTSGSTGVPKGIVGKSKGLVNRLYWVWNTYPYGNDEVCCHKISISFIDHLAEIFSPLLKGVPVVIFNSEIVSGIDDFCNLLIERKISRLIMTPSSLKLLLKKKREKGLFFKNIRYVFCSGEALPFSLAEDFYTEFSSARMINIYGSSEVSADVTYYEVNKFNVKDVLSYFNRFSLNEEYLGKYKNELGHFSKYITKPDADLRDVSRMFTNYRLYESPQTIDQYYSMLYSDVLPFIINTASPKFIGHMTSALPDYLHDLSKLISQLNQNMVKIETSKSLTFLEREALAILHRCFYKFPDKFYEDNIQKVNANLGLITTGGTTSNIGALLSARNKLLFGNYDNTSDIHESIYSIMHKKGYRDMVIIGSPLMHYSMKKASSFLGLGINNIIYVEMREDNCLDTCDLEKKIKKCIEDNILILAIVGIAGATETGVIDPLEDIASIALKYGVHFHVDAAWGGALTFSEKYCHLLKGIDKADTITLCGHKQLFLPQGISLCLFKDPFQTNYAAITAQYQASPNTYDFGRFTIEGSRSALSMCLHASLRILGKRGYEVLIDDGIEKAKFFSEIILASSAFELIQKPQINIVNYRYIPEKYRSTYKNVQLSSEELDYINTVNEMIQQKQFVSGNTFVSKTVLVRKNNGCEERITVFRAVLSNPLTTFDDLYCVLEDQLKIAEDLFDERNDYGRGVINGKVMDKKESVPSDEHMSIPIGKPIYNTKVYIVDSMNHIAPIGIAGEICVAGEAVAYGYLNCDDLNLNRFVKNPFHHKAPYDRLYRTGDLGKYLADGSIMFLGRIDDQIKIRGIRIECGEIESILCSNPEIVDAAVVGNKSLKGMVLTAFYVPSKGVKMTSEILKEYLKCKIPEYMIPYLFIELSSLPVLTNGKIDKKKLKQIAEARIEQ